MEKIKVTRQCRHCRQIKILEVSQEGWEMYLSGAHIQDALPELSDDDRELIVSGICGPCFDKMFSEEEEDE